MLHRLILSVVLLGLGINAAWANDIALKKIPNAAMVGQGPPINCFLGYLRCHALCAKWSMAA